MGDQKTEKADAAKPEDKKEQAVDFDRSNPIIVINNYARDMASDQQVKEMVAAIQSQIDEDFLPAWGLKAKLVFAEKIESPHMELDIKDYTDREGDAGYHFRDDGYPQAFVFASDSMADGAGIKGLSRTLSHEILEMIADPGVNLVAMQPPATSSGKTRLFAYEVCDPVEENYYEKKGVSVCDFVLPEWFEPQHQPGKMKMDFCRVIDAPFQVAPNGYTDIFEDGEWRTEQGKQGSKKAEAARRPRLTARKSGSKA